MILSQTTFHAPPCVGPTATQRSHTPRTCMCLAGMDHSCCPRMAAERSSQSISSVTALTLLGEVPKKEAKLLSGTCSIDVSSAFMAHHQPPGACSRSACSTSADPNESFEHVPRRAAPELLISRRRRARTEAAGNAEDGPPTVRGEDSRQLTLGRSEP